MTTIKDSSCEPDREARFIDFTGSSVAFREDPSTFMTTVRQTVGLPEPAHDLWRAGRLGEVLGIPDDRRVRIEIIGGEIVLS